MAHCVDSDFYNVRVQISGWCTDNFLYISCCKQPRFVSPVWRFVFELMQEAAGQSAQHGQYLRRLYEIHPVYGSQVMRKVQPQQEDYKLPG